MPRAAKTRPSRRLNLEMNEAVRESLESLRDQTKADSLAEVVRRALAVYDFLWDAQKKGSTFFVREVDGKKKEVVLFL